jgi:CBS domain-containing protein
MKTYEVMSVDVEAATEDANVAEVATRMVLGGFNGMPVIDKNGRLVGQITTIDILRAIRKKKNIGNVLAKELMTPNPITVHEDTDTDDVVDLMEKYGILMMPVVQKDGRLVGVCSRSDVLKETLNQRFVTLGNKRSIPPALRKPRRIMG